MRYRWLFTALLLPCLCLFMSQAKAQDDRYGADQYQEQGDAPDLSTFYNQLAPYGDWYYTGDYGYVWVPYNVGPDWRPYQNDGHWVWSDYGWMWVSDYEWGWAPFHYGRWTLIDNYYWAWIPDVVWGPAWVAWRYTDAYVGWSPLPPGAYWYPDYGLDISFSIPYGYWTFVPGRRLLEVNVYRYAVPRNQANRIYYGSRSATVYRVQRGVPVCVGVDVRTVHRWVGAPVRQVNVSISTSAGRSVVRGGSVTIYRAPVASVSVSRVAAPPPPRRAAPASLARISAPPPPSRAGVAPSQMYRARATVERSSVERSSNPAYRTAPSTERRAPTNERSAPAYERSAPPQERAAPPAERRPVERSPAVQEQRREVEQDHRELQQERRETTHDRQQLHQDMRTQPGNTQQIQRDRQEVHQDRKEVNQQRRETKEDHKELRQERREERPAPSQERSQERRSH